MNVGIIGVGGVGGYFGGKLAGLLKDDNKELNVYFFARGRHLEEIQKNGLLLSTLEEGEFLVRPTLASDNMDDFPELDLCLLCVKGYDLNNVLKMLQCKINSSTQIIPLLNGIDIYDRVKRVIGDATIYPACVYVGTHIERYGKVTQNGGACTILLGKDPVHKERQPQAIIDLFKAANIKHTFFDDVYPEIWGKYIFIAAYGMVTASENKTMGQILADQDACMKVKGIMTEIYEIALKKGIQLSEHIVEEAFIKGNNFPYDSKTSFQRDFEQIEKPNEAELFGDTIIRLGEELGIATPITLSVNNKLQRRNKNDSVS